MTRPVTNSLIIGGSRFVGPLIARRLLARGHRVILFNRGNHRLAPGLEARVHCIRGDRRNRDDLARAAAAGPDLVFDMCCYDAEQAALALALFRGRVRHYCYMGSAAAYREPSAFPLLETDPLGEWPVWGGYGLNKARADETFLHADRFPVTVLRPTYILGPGNHVEREVFFLDRLSRGLPVVLPGDGRNLVQFAFAEDVAECAVRLAEIPGTAGEAYNCAGDRCVTLLGFTRLCARLLGRDPAVLLADLDRYRISRSPYLPTELSPFSDEHFIVSNAKLRQAVGMEFAPLETGLQEVVDRFRQDADRAPVSFRPRELEVLRQSGFEPPGG